MRALEYPRAVITSQRLAAGGTRVAPAARVIVFKETPDGRRPAAAKELTTKHSVVSSQVGRLPIKLDLYM